MTHQEWERVVSFLVPPPEADADAVRQLCGYHESSGTPRGPRPPAGCRLCEWDVRHMCPGLQRVVRGGAGSRTRCHLAT